MNEILIDFSKAVFLKSAPDIGHLPEDTGIEIAFAGRSNAGKSSALNTLTNQKSLARTSKTPGRTQLINLFDLSENRRLVDLPGYGYAKVPLSLRKEWQKSLSEYLDKRQCLKAIVALMDIRHPLKETDMELLAWAASRGLSVLVLLTKADKLKQGERHRQVMKVREAVAIFQGDIRVEAFSSLKRMGVDRLRKILTQWYTQEDVAEEHGQLVLGEEHFEEDSFDTDYPNDQTPES